MRSPSGPEAAGWEQRRPVHGARVLTSRGRVALSAQATLLCPLFPRPHDGACLCAEIYHGNPSTCTVWWHQVHSWCRGTVSTVHLSDFAIFQTEAVSPLTTLPVSPSPQPLAPTALLSVSADFGCMESCSVGPFVPGLVYNVLKVPELSALELVP